MDNITHKKSSASPRSIFSCPVRFHKGFPVCDGVNLTEWQLFGFDCQEDFEAAVEEEQRAAFEAAEAAALAADDAAVLVNTEKHEPKRTKAAENEDIRQRFKLMEYIKEVLRPYLQKNSSILKCYRVPCSDAVKFSQGVGDDGKECAKVEGVSHDHNVHVCPSCALKISMGRAIEIDDIIRKARSEGFECYFLTITMEHHRWDDLRVLLKDMQKASEKFWRNGTIRRIWKENFNYRITALEIMFGFEDIEGNGGNGAHPHKHILIIGKKGVDIAYVQEQFEKAWLKALGGKGKEGVALKLELCEEGKDVAEFGKRYLTKEACEISLGSVRKKGHGESFTFFQLARLSMTFPYLRQWLEPMMVAYYQATKGKRQLVFSDGLKKRFGVQDKTDDELAEESGEKIKKLAVVSNKDYWAKLLHSDIAETRILCRDGDREGLRLYLRSKGILPFDSVEQMQDVLNGCILQPKGESVDECAT